VAVDAYVLERTQRIPRPLGEVFPFFADAYNLEAITPPFLRFRILTPRPIPMAPGSCIDYRLQLFGIPFRWRTRIERFDPGVGFVDAQIRGPYRLWHHTHEFERAGDATHMRDVVRYALPLGPLGTLAHTIAVRRMLDEIFAFRRRRIEEIFA
jgi:ligand-binding SRPBCC domain-containing protein